MLTILRLIAAIALLQTLHASQVQSQPLDEAAGCFDHVLLVTVLEASHEPDVRTFTGGVERTVELAVTYRCRVDESLAGVKIDGEIHLNYSFTVPVVYNDNGDPILQYSPESLGSGSELQLVAGTQYAVGVASVGASEPETHSLIRAEAADRGVAMATAWQQIEAVRKSIPKP
jgi:hypothetical protein